MKIKDQIKESYKSIKEDNSGFITTYNSIISFLVFVLIMLIGLTLFFGALDNKLSNNKQSGPIPTEKDDTLNEIKEEILDNIIFMKKVQELYSQVEKD